MKSKVIAILVLSIFASCNQELKPVEKENSKDGSFFEKGSDNNTNGQAETHVIIEEILQGERYSYIKVKDDKNGAYWISTLKEEYEVGEEYFFTEAIHKTNFFSTEFNRNFEDFYLVSDLQPASGHNHDHGDQANNQVVDMTVNASEVNRVGSTKIKELISNSKKYAGKEVEITGKVVKVNANIMDRHWVHIKDASADDYDFVLTTKAVVPVGHIVTFKGKFNTNVDFGSGYRFDYILEDAKTIR